MNDNDFNATPPQGQSSYQYGDSASQPRQQSGQTPFQDPNAGQQTSSYQPYAGSVPPSGPGSMPPVGPQVYYAPAPNQKWNTLCIIGFVLSFLMPVIGLVLSVVALVQINRSGEKARECP
ncbi:DUF4190 domain-containing protein [Bifidobacterium sp. ESL0798]|uniref:DUF4190 domain-containing protein n=1 Tax=Bifidobacterium sp. ESL0798 TaxID=2983235 RepID=UPI0023F6A21E|nr:DUF4190 domain-containing protein [Bifidobacterium sp. ESL0798]WEV74465.1 DUF4190 domain-containing protein [Bifidobacterium sp. ESL0798]